jgi:Leucine-rich repeat (LRR) protein
MLEYYARNNFKEVPIETTDLIVQFHVENFKGLKRLVNLRTLIIKNNSITSFKGFPQLEELTHLNLSDNKITSFKHIPNFPNLVTLSLKFNEIESFEYMPSFPKLEWLYLHGNDFTSFENFPHLPKLRECDISDNYFISFNGISLENFRATSIYTKFFKECLREKGFSDGMNIVEMNDDYARLGLRQNVEIPQQIVEMSDDYTRVSQRLDLNIDIITLIAIRHNTIISQFNTVLSKLITRDINEHKEAIIKNENEEDILIGTLFISYCVYILHSLDMLLFAIENNIQIKYTKDIILENAELLYESCLKHNNVISKEIILFMKDNGKTKMQNGDAFFF